MSGSFCSPLRLSPPAPAVDAGNRVYVLDCLFCAPILNLIPPMQHDSLGKAVAVIGWLTLILAAALIYFLTRDL